MNSKQSAGTLGGGGGGTGPDPGASPIWPSCFAAIALRSCTALANRFRVSVSSRARLLFSVSSLICLITSATSVLAAAHRAFENGCELQTITSSRNHHL